MNSAPLQHARVAMLAFSYDSIGVPQYGWGMFTSNATWAGAEQVEYRPWVAYGSIEEDVKVDDEMLTEEVIFHELLDIR